MSDNKKYYYLKLKDTFFDDERIKILESMPNGIYYSNLLLKLYLRSLKNNGKLTFTETIPYSLEMISTITNINIDTVRTGINILIELQFIDKLNNGKMFMSEIQNFIGQSSTEGDRKRLYRKEIEKLMLPSGQMSDERPPEIEIEKDIEKEKEIKKKTDKELYLDAWERFPHKSDLKKIILLFPEKMQPKTDKQKLNWVNECNKLLNVDKYSIPQIVDVVTFARSNDFWKSNLLSFMALRKKNDVGVPKIESIMAKMECKNKVKLNKNHVNHDQDEWKDGENW